MVNLKKFVLICLLTSCMIVGCTEKDSKAGHNKTLGDYIIEDLMDVRTVEGLTQITVVTL